MARLISTNIEGTLNVTGKTTLKDLSAINISGNGTLITNIQWNNIDNKTNVIAGNGLIGGGNLGADVTLNIESANDGISINPDNIQLNSVDNLTTDSATQPLSARQGKNLQDTKVAKTTKVNVGGGLTGGGSLGKDITITHPGSAASVIERIPNVVTGVSFSNGHVNNVKTYNLDDRYYTESEIDNKFSEISSGLDWKPSVPTYDAILSTYPNPEDGWTVNVDDTDYTYRFTGTAWIAISANSIPLATASVDGKMSKAYASKLDGIAQGANRYVHPNHTGDVTSSGDGATSIVNGKVTNAKLATVSQNTIKGRVSANTGTPEDLTPAQVRTMINVSNGAEVNQPAFSMIKIGAKQALAVSKTDVMEFVAGSNIQLSLDETTKKITITNAYAYTHPVFDAPKFTQSTNTTSANVLYSVTTNNGHVTSGTYKTITPGSNITVETNVAGEIKINNTYKYTHPTGDGNLHVPATGTENNEKFLMAGASEGELLWQAPPLATSTKPGYLKQLTGSTTEFMRADGTWAVPPSVTYNEYIGTFAGLVPNGNSLSSQDKTSKFLRGDGTWQTPYTLPQATSSVLGGVKIGQGINVSAGTISVPNATTSSNGLMISADKVKLDGIETGANKYIHPAVSRTNTTSSTKPAAGGTFTAIDGVTTNAEGHITGVNTKTITMPIADKYVLPPATKTALGGVIVGDRINVDAAGKISIANYEPAFTKNSGFNKNFGTSSGTVSEGNHTHNQLSGTNYVSGGNETPVFFGASKLRYQMLGGGTQANGSTKGGIPGVSWSDALWISAYGADVPGATALLFSKYSDEIGFRRQARYDQTTWGAYYKFWHSGNFDPTTKTDASRNINTSGSISGGGNLTADRTITHLTTTGHKHIPSGGASGQYLKWSADGTASWSALGLLVKGSYLTGGNYDGGTSTTWAVDATPNATANKVVARDGNGYSSFASIRSELANQTGALTGVALAYRTTAADGHIRFTTDNAAVRNWLGLEGSLTSYVKKSGDTMTGALTVQNKINANSISKNKHILSPTGGTYETTATSVAGAMRVTLPSSFVNSMMSFWIDVYEYRRDQSFSVFVSGYCYSPSTTWANNPTVLVSGSNESITVRLGNNGGKPCVLIREGNHTWSYPQAVVRDIHIGYSYTNFNEMSNQWNIDFTSDVTTGTTYTSTKNAWHSGNLTFGTGANNMATGNHTHSPDQVGLSNVPNTVHTTAANASTVVVRDSAADITARLLRTTYANEARLTGAIAFRVNNSTDNYTRYCSDPAAVRGWLGLETSLTSYVKKTGDTMSGTLNSSAQYILKSTLSSCSIYSSATEFGLTRADNAWTMRYNKTSGDVIFSSTPSVSGNLIFHKGNLPTKADVGLSAVNNWGASSSINANSTTEYATTNMVAQVKSYSENAGQYKARGNLPSFNGTFGDFANKVSAGAYVVYPDIAGPLSLPSGVYAYGVLIVDYASTGKERANVVYVADGSQHIVYLNSWNFSNSPTTTITEAHWNRTYHAKYKPSSADVGLGNVNNWGASSDGNNNSTATYATTAMVHSRINARVGNVNNWGASSAIGANSTSEYATTNMVAQVRAEKLSANNSNGALYPLAYLDGTNDSVGTMIRLPFLTNAGKMVTFTVRVYQGYNHSDIQFSGYLYASNNQWYLPKATLISSTLSSINVRMGKDNSGYAYVWIPGGGYRGVAVLNVVGGYSNANWNSGWVISKTDTTPNLALNSTIYPPLVNPGYGGVHELGRYLDLHVSGSSADYDARIWTDGGQTVLTSGDFHTNGKIFAHRRTEYGGTPAISLAIGDGDTGFNWAGDGNVQMWANNTNIGYWTNAGLHMHQSKYFHGTPLGTDYWNAMVSHSPFKAINSVNPGSTWSSGFYQESHIVGVGYILRSSLGHLRGTSGWGAIQLKTFGDNSSQINTGWTFNPANGDFSSPGNVIAYSDSRLKKNVEIIANPIEKIKRINGYTYDRIDKNVRQMGVIAQEILEVIPEVVSEVEYDIDEKVLGVSYGNIVALLIEGIKEQQKQIEDLKSILKNKK